MIHPVFILFGTAVIAGLVFTFLFVPETKGISIEEMDILFNVPGKASTKRKRTLEIIAESRANRAKFNEKEGHGMTEKMDLPDMA